MSIFKVSLALLTVLACASPSPDSEPAEPAQPAAPVQPIEVGLDLQAKLALADAADGEVDHVVSLCPGCALAMEGSYEYPLDVSQYSLHFCSDDCKDRFNEDTEGSLLALVVPEADGLEDDQDVASP